MTTLVEMFTLKKLKESMFINMVRTFFTLQIKIFGNNKHYDNRSTCWMLPICQVRRWFSLIFGGRIGKAKREFEMNKIMDTEYRDTVNDMIKYLGI